MNKTQDEEIIEEKANSVVLYTALGINIVLMIYAIYLSGSVATAVQPDLSIGTAMWEFTTSGGMVVHGFAISALILIGVLHAANQAIGKKSPLIGKIARILLKLPINIILVLLALFVAFMGYGKFEVGMNTANLNGGGYILDWITAAALSFLVFFVKKV
ncbi:hypothetical protein N9R62_03585 [Porticoccaceae bacterium]|nr:hypothetical protein [Porticoccaceae bacterium]